MAHFLENVDSTQLVIDISDGSAKTQSNVQKLSRQSSPRETTLPRQLLMLSPKYQYSKAKSIPIQEVFKKKFSSGFTAGATLTPQPPSAVLKKKKKKLTPPFGRIPETPLPSEQSDPMPFEEKATPHQKPATSAPLPTDNNHFQSPYVMGRYIDYGRLREDIEYGFKLQMLMVDRLEGRLECNEDILRSEISKTRERIRLLEKIIDIRDGL